MHEWAVRFVAVSNMSPTFKGASVALVGLLALVFAYWMNRRWQEPLKGGFLVFVGVAGFILLYGLFVLVFQPQWWKLPY